VGGRRELHINALLDGNFNKAEMMQWIGSDRDAARFWSSARHFQIQSIESEVFRVRPWSVPAWSSLTLLHVVQGSDLEGRPLAFDQLLKFIKTMRSSGRRARPVTFIGISRTGLTSNMVRQITSAIAFLPTNTFKGAPSILEMQKVVVRALCFISPRQP
jgi:hypothetical protein